jgi:hypothetical protein
MIPTSFVFWTLRIRFTHKLSRSLQRGASSSFHSSGLGRSDMAQHHAIRNLGLGQALILGVSHSLAFSQNAASIAYAVGHSVRPLCQLGQAAEFGWRLKHLLNLSL